MMWVVFRCCVQKGRKEKDDDVRVNRLPGSIVDEAAGAIGSGRGLGRTFDSSISSYAYAHGPTNTRHVPHPLSAFDLPLLLLVLGTTLKVV